MKRVGRLKKKERKKEKGEKINTPASMDAPHEVNKRPTDPTDVRNEHIQTL